ncbi:MAG: hypothetical protein K9L60_02655 [Methylovulum sp.]|jgi:hypothetical protein|nr:hypothetical protein [Methylovulum sp.]MCF7998080.1 hypothetical protein [Methylovulum sp.]
MAHTHGKQLVQGAAASATVHTGKQLMKNIAKHPALVFGLGLVTGYLVYKYRKEIIASSTKVVDAGKDFVLQQKENLEDIVAEIQEDAN